MRILIIPCAALLLYLSGCKQTAPAEEPFKAESITKKSTEISEIVYSMYLPTDIATVLSETGSNYDPEIPASIDDYALYSTDEQIAVMLGVYGVDMMYMKLLGQIPLAASYFQVVKNLAGNTDIPNQIFEESIQKLEKNLHNQDSIASVIEDIFRKTKEFYNQNGKTNLSSLSLMGGWLETMYIGVNILESDPFNTMMAERILQQKYSLNTIYTMVRNHQESLNSRKYMLMLKRLRNAFEDVEIKYEKEGFNVDTSSRKIQSVETHITYTEDTFEEIKTLIRLIRNELIKAG